MGAKPTKAIAPLFLGRKATKKERKKELFNVRFASKLFIVSDRLKIYNDLLLNGILFVVRNSMTIHTTL